jgi:DnaJ-class molecular chaperone
MVCNWHAHLASTFREMIEMVRKETCPACKGNRYVTVKNPSGHEVPRKCPTCGGQGFRVRITH